ncbi:histidine decarboxylase [Streptomyces sp. NPDC023327]|uniref:histidine decarboxylase n=1 Tax=Streptomyces sp. NPDC023327 TaxID=3157088 RepID=UPI0033F6C765
MRVPLEEDLAIADEPRTAEGLAADRALLNDVASWMRNERAYSIGAPVNLDIDYRHLAPFLAVHGNNAGSPCGTSEYRLHTKHFERAVVDFFATLAGAPSGAAFGYVSNGGTESNLFGVFVGRERHPDAVLYASRDVHYSVPKIARLLRMELASIPTGRHGAMDPRALESACRANRHRAAVVVATIGSTGRGAVDDLPAIHEALSGAGVERAHLHADAAFGGPLAALGPSPRPWGFADGADSIAISGHKMVGCPIPCGIVLTRPEHMDNIREKGAAVGADDDTIGGSRDALSPVLLWHELRRLGREGMVDRVRECLRIAEYAAERLGRCGRRPTHRSGTNTVLFDAPSQAMCERWHLFQVDGRAHLVTMPHVTEDHVDRLCAELTDPPTDGTPG